MYGAIEKALKNKKEKKAAPMPSVSSGLTSAPTGGGFTAIESALKRKDEIISSSAKKDIGNLYNKYNELVGSAEKRYAQAGYRADYSTWKEQTSTATGELSSISKKLRRNIDSYRTVYGDEYADSIVELLDSIDKGLISLNDAANNDYKIFSQFADENEYNTALSTYEMQKKAESLSSEERKKLLKNAKTYETLSNLREALNFVSPYAKFNAEKTSAAERERLGFGELKSAEEVKRWASVLANVQNSSYGDLDISEEGKTLETLKDELEKVTANRERVIELRGNILQKNTLNLTENKVRELEKEVKSLSLDGSADADTILVSYNKRVDELKKQISGLEKDLQSAGKVQSFNALGAVMDPTSEFYNPDFEKYVQEGASRFGNVVEGVKNGKTAEELGISKDDYYRYKQMTDDEVKLYNYYNSSYYDSEYHNSKKQKTLIGEQYIDELDKSFDSLTARAAQAYYDEVLKNKSDVEKIFSSVGANLERWGQNLGRAFDAYVVGSINPNHYGKEYYRGDVSQGASAIAREDLGALGKVAYDALGAASYMLPSIATSAIVGTVSKSTGAAIFANALTMGVPVAGQAYEEMINLGYSEEQAKTYGILAGASEFATEAFLNGAGKGLGKAVEPFADSIGKVMGRFAIEHGDEIAKFIAQAGSEAVEEMVQEVLDPILRTIATGDLHDGATIEEVLYSGLLGGITAMGINTVDVAFNKVSQAVADRKAEAFTQNEQVVFDKIVENRIAEFEARGEKVTSAEKKNIKKSVRQEFENGEISTSDIEEALEGNWQPNVEQDKRIVRCYVRELQKKEAIKADFQEVLRRNGLSEEEAEAASAILAESVVNNRKLKGETAESLSTEGVANVSNTEYNKSESEGNVNGEELQGIPYRNTQKEGVEPGRIDTGRTSQEGEVIQQPSSAVQGKRGRITRENVGEIEQNSITPNDVSYTGKILHEAKEDYGIDTVVVSDNAWSAILGEEASTIKSYNGKIYIRENVENIDRRIVVPHEATHVMRQLEFKPYLDFVAKTQSFINLYDTDAQVLCDNVLAHCGLDIDALNEENSDSLLLFCDELNATVYGEYKARRTEGEIEDGTTLSFYNVFNNFDEYIAELSGIHEQFKKYRKEKQDNSTKPDVNHIGGISAPSGKDVPSALNDTNSQRSEKEKTLQEEEGVETNEKITRDMSDARRAEILKNKKIKNVPVVETLTKEVEDDTEAIYSWEDVDNLTGSGKRNLIHKLITEFGVFKEYTNADVKLDFNFSHNNYREAYGKQQRNYGSFAKMFSVFDAVVERAVGVEVHNRNEEGYKMDSTLENVYVLISAFEDGDSIVPVKLEVKEFNDKNNTLYVAVSLEAIKKTEVSKQGNTENGVTQNSRSVNISIPELFSKINPQDQSFLKYVPDELLTDEQLEAKVEGQEKATQLELIQKEIENNKKLQKNSKERFDKRIEQLQKEYDSKQNKNTLVANGILRRIERQSRLREQNDLEYSRRIEQLKFQEENVRKGYTSTRKKRHQEIIESIKTAFSEKGFDFVEVLKKAKRLSTFSTVDNTPQRAMEKALGYKQGQILADLTVNKVAQNETEGIKWLNYYTDKKNGVLARISKEYNIKPGSKESAAAQMYAEGFYVNEMNELVRYGDEELCADFPNYQTRKNIIGLSRDSRIRDIYNETLDAINESRKRNGYPEIKRLDNYFLHFRAMDDTFSKLGLPFNPNDIRAKDLPTNLNGVTANLKPGQPYFASAKHRRGKRTSFDLLGGLERYLSSAKNQIYHIDDIQTLRALRNYIADNYGQSAESFEYDLLAEETIRDRLKDIKEAHLSTFASFLNEEANVVAGKTPLIDRGLEGFLGRRAITTLNAINSQVGSNMVGLNASSSLTNFLAGIQSIAKNNPRDSMKSLAETVGSRTRRLFGKKDAFVEENPTIIRRRGAKRFYRTPYEKIKDVGYVFMSAVDDVVTEFIVRSKYNEFVRKGMNKQEAINEADKWTSRLMGDRSLGQQPQLFNSKTFGLFTKFQLEVRNQLDSQFYDTVKERSTANENIENALKRNAKTATEVATTFVALAVLQHLFGKAFESVAGYNPAFDVVDVFLTALGIDDDEKKDDNVLDNLSQAFVELLEDLPYTSTITGGRIPISSALPIRELLTGKDQYGKERARWKTLLDTIPWYILPTGFGQVKKSVMGGLMYDTNEKRPIAGSYTFSGKLRFPVENDPLSFAQAIVFGQYSSSTARDYFDEGRSPLTDKQLNVFVQMGEDMTIQEYWDFLDEISAINKAKKKDKSLDAIKMKVEYIVSLDLPLSKKNILVNSILNRKNPVDLQGFGKLSGFAEWDFSMQNEEKYQFLKDNGISYQLYASSEDVKETYDNDYQWYKSNPEKVTLSKAVTGTVVEYREIARQLNSIKADKDEDGNAISGSAKEKRLDYINSLDDLEYGAKLVLYKDLYPSDDSVNEEIIEYINSLNLTAAEKKTILKGLKLG